jgi:hypothetical protein
VITVQPYQQYPTATPAAATAPAGRGTSPFVKALPLAVNTLAAAVAHQWHYQGAAHSIGDAVICGGIAVTALWAGAALSKVQSIPPTALALTYGTGGALLGVSVIGYAQAPAIALLAWLAGTVISYALAATGWTRRSERRDERAHEREMLLIQEQAKTERTQIKAGAQVSVARELGAAWAAERMAVDSFNQRYPSSIPVFGAVALNPAKPDPLDFDAQLRALTGSAETDGLDLPDWLTNPDLREQP